MGVLRLLLCGCAAAALAATCASPAAAAAAAAAAHSDANHDFLVAGAPSGFDDLAQPREVLVDIYYGGKKVGSAVAVARPGFLQFRNPNAVASLIPNLANTAGLASALSGDLATHASLVCSQSNAGQCGTLSTEQPGIIFDEGHFRVDVFVPAGMLREIAVTQSKFLDTPSGVPSLTSTVGFALSGARGQPTSYNFQDRTIVALGPARVRTDLSYASKVGLIFDDLVGEMDSRDLRYSAGLFWAPGVDLTGRRRIVGVGLGTQFDTRADRDSLTGTPLVLFLSQPARVEFLIDGRLVGSRAYDAGNNILDTSGLPEGSYQLVLRINQADGTVREEHRFFVKTPQVAPVGQPLYFAYAGVLANTRPDRPISLSDTFYYQAGTARRLNRQVAVDLSIIGTQHKSMAEAGVWLLTPIAQVRAAGLVSTDGDTAALLQGVSNGRSRFNFAFDLRRVWSRDGKPLIPLPVFIDSFGTGQPTSSQIGGSYIQASGTIGYSLGSAYLSVIGSLRKDDHQKSDYSIGPSLTWSILNRNGFQVTLQADAQRTRTTTATFAGFRLIYTGKNLSVVSSAGHGSLTSRDGSQPSTSRAIGGLSANYFNEDSNRTQVSAGGGIERSLDSTIAQAGGTIYSNFGNLRADVLDNLEGRGGLQYGVTVQSAVALAGTEVGFGARDLEDSAIIVDVGGDAGNSSFQVLVNGSSEGHVRSVGSLPIHLEPYRAYEVRLHPDGAAPVAFDADAQTVTLYPGTVRVVRWTAHSYFTAFGKAVAPDGKPIANAMVQAPHSIGESDENGYFQVDVANEDVLTFTHGSQKCEVRVTGAKPTNDLASLGKVICQ